MGFWDRFFEEPVIEVPSRCALCGSESDTFEFTEYLTGARNGWRLVHRATRDEVSGGTDANSGPLTFSYDICRQGHIWPRPISGVRVVKMVGTVAAGKTALLRSLYSQVPASVPRRAVPRLCFRRFDPTLHTEATLLQSTTHYAVITEHLRREFESGIDEVDDLVTRCLGLPSGSWGKDTRIPYHLLTQTNAPLGWPHPQPVEAMEDTVFVDLAGEVSEAYSQNQGGAALNAMSRTDAVIWAIDAAVLPPVRSTLSTQTLRESLRPKRFENASDIPTALATTADQAFAASEQIARVFTEIDPAGLSRTPRAVAITKADLILEMLKSGRGWAAMLSYRHYGAIPFHVGGRNYLATLIDQRQRIPADASVSNLLNSLAEFKEVTSRVRVLEEIVAGVMDFYADPVHFHDLVIAEPVADDFAELSSGEPLHVISCAGPHLVELEVPRIGGEVGTTLQMRDVVVGILARCLLGATFDEESITVIERTAHTRYFMVAPLNVLNGLSATYIGQRTPGVTHLLSWVLGLDGGRS